MAKKIAVSMPDALFNEMERARKREGKDRSAWLQDVVSRSLRLLKREADVAAYIRGYEKYPETEDEIASVEAALKVGPLYDEEWPEAPR
jgi:metal-responsive CopG/Arc/MetJ family transcriptional regulator